MSALTEASFIEEMDISVRAYNVLRRADPEIKTVGDLVQWHRFQLLHTKACGLKVANEIEDELLKHGLKLAEVTLENRYVPVRYRNLGPACGAWCFYA